MAFEHLKVKPLQRATASWANAIVDALNQLYGQWKEVYKRGTAENPFYELYGYYGYFFNELYVQGKRVIKDGDPVNLYDIFEPAKQDIREVIDQSLLTQYMRNVRDKFLNIRVDEYGNIGVTIAELAEAPTKIYEFLPRAITQLKEIIPYGIDTSSKISDMVSYIYDIKDRFYRIYMDEYGNIGVVLATPIEALAEGPVKVYEFLPKAESQLKEVIPYGIDSSSKVTSIEALTSEIRDRFYSIHIDEYGNIGVKLTTPVEVTVEAPAQIYNFSPEALDQLRKTIKTGIDESSRLISIESYTKDVSDRFRKISIDEYGNIGVRLNVPVEVSVEAPAQIYSFSTEAREQLKESVKTAIDTSTKITSIEAYIKDVRDKTISLKIDAYGNIGVTIAEPIDEYGNVRVKPHEETLRTVIREELAPVREGVEKILEAYSISAGGKAEFTVTSTSKYSALVVTIKASYDPNASNGVRIRWLYSPDGVNYDSPEDAEAQGNYEDLTFEKGKTRQRTILIPLLLPYVKVEIINLDTGYSVTVDVWRTFVR